ncbi:MAG TPA: adenylyl-sulfate kinase [Gammaproteobacteria bacterium]|nr:putative adenylyl-sulfate kinase [bacterium BMS3Abin11]HDH17133.1 adenylyl-sulfate kinase [Gammaproteobacteria bacterium]HDZ78236.1 adenylyl-sulfate kinase [Gammaproteobacteria bacterium]
MKSDNVVWHQTAITRQDRNNLHNHESIIIWFTGLSGAGKSTLANALEQKLHATGCATIVLDGDNVRHGLCGDLSFSTDGREENIRRIGEMSKLFIDAGVIAITAFISPFRHDRRRVRDLVEEGDFIEVYCRCSLDTCEKRDIKGIYKLARSGEIKEFTGISSPYEEPEQADITVDTDKHSIEECVDQIVTELEGLQLFNKKTPLNEVV